MNERRHEKRNFGEEPLSVILTGPSCRFVRVRIERKSALDFRKKSISVSFFHITTTNIVDFSLGKWWEPEPKSEMLREALSKFHK
jgi:hypothetical protein